MQKLIGGVPVEELKVGDPLYYYHVTRKSTPWTSFVSTERATYAGGVIDEKIIVSFEDTPKHCRGVHVKNFISEQNYFDLVDLLRVVDVCGFWEISGDKFKGMVKAWNYLDVVIWATKEDGTWWFWTDRLEKRQIACSDDLWSIGEAHRVSVEHDIYGDFYETCKAECCVELEHFTVQTLQGKFQASCGGLTMKREEGQNWEVSLDCQVPFSGINYSVKGRVKGESLSDLLDQILSFPVKGFRENVLNYVEESDA